MSSNHSEILTGRRPPPAARTKLVFKSTVRAAVTVPASGASVRGKTGRAGLRAGPASSPCVGAWASKSGSKKQAAWPGTSARARRAASPAARPNHRRRHRGARPHTPGTLRLRGDQIRVGAGEGGPSARGPRLRRWRGARERSDWRRGPRPPGGDPAVGRAPLLARLARRRLGVAGRGLSIQLERSRGSRPLDQAASAPDSGAEARWRRSRGRRTASGRGSHSATAVSPPAGPTGPASAPRAVPGPSRRRRRRLVGCASASGNRSAAARPAETGRDQKGAWAGCLIGEG